MGNLTSSLGIGLSGLQASQEAMSVIGHNIANVNTPDYSQQQAMLSTNPAQDVGNIMFGSGVTVTSVQALRNQFLNLQLTQSLCSQSASSTTYNGIQAVASAFTDDGTTGLNTQLSQFFSSVSTLAGNPTSAALSENVVGTAQSMLQEFQSAYQTVSGQISVETAEVRGTVGDHLVVQSKLTLRSSGSISGSISYSKIMVEEGGELAGTIEKMAPRNAGTTETDPRVVQLQRSSE